MGKLSRGESSTYPEAPSNFYKCLSKKNISFVAAYQSFFLTFIHHSNFLNYRLIVVIYAICNKCLKNQLFLKAGSLHARVQLYSTIYASGIRTYLSH
jgi:hypothetical protein